jgi:RNA polymerase sigma-70 factor, ECF subfamily
MNDLSIGEGHKYNGLSHDADGPVALDQELGWIAAAQANPVAFEPLYLRYRERVYRYIRTRLNSDEDAADLTQQVFLQAMDALPRYRPHGVPFAVWLFRIARHTAINLSSRRPGCVSWDALPAELSPVEAVEQGPEARVVQRETLEHIHKLLASLNSEKRELLALRFAAGLNATQIAALVGKKPEAVKKQINRLLQSFKEQYQHEHP